MKYRSRTDIAAQVLKAAGDGGATKTRIMYKAFLSYAQLKEYLAVLDANGLLDFDKNTQTYRTTERGHRFLQSFERLDEMMVTEEDQARRARRQ